MHFRRTLLPQFHLRSIWCAVLWVIVPLGIRAQDQTLSDSLEAIYLAGEFTFADELSLLKTLAEEQGDVDKKIRYAELLIRIARERDSTHYVYSGFLQKGNALRLKGDLTLALESLFDAAKIATDAKQDHELGLANVAIADVYSTMGNHERAVRYYHEAIDQLAATNDSVNLASAYLNAGDEYFNHGDLDTALIYFESSGKIFDALDYELGVAYNKGNIGLVHAQSGAHDLAEKNIAEAVDMLERLGDYYPISVYLTFMSDIYLEKNESGRALEFAEQSLQLAQAYGLKDQISSAYLKLSEIYEQLGETEKALQYYRDHVTYKDSVTNITSVQEMADMRADYEVTQKQLEVDLLQAQKKSQALILVLISIALLIIGGFAVFLHRRNVFVKRTNAIIQGERDRSDKLLLNILPEETAHELKEHGKVQARRYEEVTVLFTDFKAFTAFAETATPERLVEAVNYYFSKFDEIITKYRLEKIKTIGDAYMAAAGLPFPEEDSAVRMVKAAMEMAEFVHHAKDDLTIEEARFDVRIGMNTGPVVAGVVGTKKFAYDIWGDTVNIAARMETLSHAGMINISESTYRRVGHHFNCVYRGEIEVKNRGMLKMYFVKGEK